MNKPRVPRPHFGRIDLLLIIAFVALSMLVLFVILKYRWHGLRNPDEMDFAQLARNLSEGKGFVTNYISPMSLYISDRLVGHPDLWRAPLFPILMAGAFKMFGPVDLVALAPSLIAFVLTVGLSYLITLDMFGRTTAIWATMLVMTCPPLIEYAIQAQTESTSTACLLLTILAARRRVSPPLLGIISGLCYLVHYSFFFVTPMLILFIWLDGERHLVKYIAFMLGLGLTLAPWAIRNMLVAGSPLFSLQAFELVMFNSRYPDYYFYHSFSPPSPLRTALSMPVVMVAKILRGVSGLLLALPGLTGQFYTGALALFGLIGLKESEARDRRLMVVVGTGAGMALIVGSIVHPLLRKFVAFMPFVMILAANGIRVLVQQVVSSQRRFLALAALMTLTVFVDGIMAFGRDYGQPSFVRLDEISFVQSQTQSDESVITDSTAVLAWYGRRQEVWFASSYKSFKQHKPEIRFAYFGPGEPGQSRRAALIGSEYLYNPAFHEDFELIKRFESGSTCWRKR